MIFTELEKDILKHCLTEMSDEDLYDHFGDIFQVVKERLIPIRKKLQRKKATVYSNVSHQHELHENQ